MGNNNRCSEEDIPKRCIKGCRVLRAALPFLHCTLRDWSLWDWDSQINASMPDSDCSVKDFNFSAAERNLVWSDTNQGCTRAASSVPRWAFSTSKMSSSCVNPHSEQRAPYMDCYSRKWCLGQESWKEGIEWFNLFWGFESLGIKGRLGASPPPTATSRSPLHQCLPYRLLDPVRRPLTFSARLKRPYPVSVKYSPAPWQDRIPRGFHVKHPV